jgi:hypothetical protein
MKFNNYPAEHAGHVELGDDGTRYDMQLIHDGSHALFNADASTGFTFLGIIASHDVSEPRIASETIPAEPQDTLEILKPVVDQVGEAFDKDKAIWFARGVFHGIRVDFPDFRSTDEWEQHKLFQTLISGVSEEAAEAISRRADSSMSTSISS